MPLLKSLYITYCDKITPPAIFVLIVLLLVRLKSKCHCLQITILIYYIPEVQFCLGQPKFSEQWLSHILQPVKIDVDIL